MPRHRFLLHILLAAPLAWAGTVAANSGAETISPEQIDPDQVIERVAGMPERGTSMESVQQRLGDPERRVAPVGEPPITRWVYDRFTVYFEHDRVLHAVKNQDR